MKLTLPYKFRITTALAGALLLVLACSSCGTIRTHAGISHDYEYDFDGHGHRYKKPKKHHKKPKKDKKHRHHHHDDD